MALCIRQVVKEVEKARGRRGVSAKDILKYLETRLYKAVKKGILTKKGKKFNLAKICKSAQLKKSKSDNGKGSRHKTDQKTSKRDSSVLRREQTETKVASKRTYRKIKTINKKAVQLRPQEEPQKDAEHRTRRCRGNYNLRRNSKLTKSLREFGVRCSKVKNSFCENPSKTAKIQRKKLFNKLGEATTSKQVERRSRSRSRKNRAFMSQNELPASSNQRIVLSTVTSEKEPSPSRVSKREEFDSDDDNLSESQSRLLGTRDSLEVLKERISRKSLDQESTSVPSTSGLKPANQTSTAGPSSAIVPEKCSGVVTFDLPRQPSCLSKTIFSVFSWPPKH